jgi:HAD superfamily hydrolase (TIGR01509 family)
VTATVDPWPGRRIRGVLFDYGFTLVSFSRVEPALHRAHVRVAARLAAADLGPVPPAATLLREVHDRVERGLAEHEESSDLTEVDIAALERAAYAELGLHPPAALLDELDEVVQRAWWEAVTVTPGAVAVIATLRARGLRLGLCSNAAYRPAGMRAQMDHLGLGPLLDSITLSSEVGWRKPAPQLFVAALGALGVAAEDCVMVGDRRHTDVAGARAVGMATVRIRQHRDDPGPEDADVVIDGIDDLVPLVCGDHTGGVRGSVHGSDAIRAHPGGAQEA